jgi:hypothetical protein
METNKDNTPDKEVREETSKQVFDFSRGTFPACSDTLFGRQTFQMLVEMFRSARAVLGRQKHQNRLAVSGKLSHPITQQGGSTHVFLGNPLIHSIPTACALTVWKVFGPDPSPSPQDQLCCPIERCNIFSIRKRR